MCSIITTVMSTLSTSMCTGNSCLPRCLVDTEVSCLVVPLTVPHNGCCIQSDYRNLPLWFCWAYISSNQVNILRKLREVCTVVIIVASFPSF